MKPSQNQKTGETYNRYKIILTIILIVFALLFIIQRSYYKQKQIEMLEQIEEIEMQLDYCKHGAEDIYDKIQMSFKNKDYNDCKKLFVEMKTNYYNSKIFDDVNEIYQKVIEIEDKIKEEYSVKKEIEQAEIRERLKKVYIYVQAQAYSDGIISCNLYLYDPSEQQYRFDRGFLSYKVYDYRDDLFASNDSIYFSGFSKSIFIDIPIGKYISKASTIEFEYITAKNNKFKSKRVEID